MALANVELTNTFNEFRTAYNLAAKTINNVQDGTESINVATATVATATITTANITSVDSNLVPAANLTYDLGSSSLWWNDLYLSGNTIFLGNAQIKAESDTVKLLVNGEEVFTADADGSIPAANAITANTVTINNLTSGRVALVGTSGLITDDAGLTFNTSTDALSVAGAVDVGSLSTTTTLGVGTDLTVTGNTALSTNLDVTGTLDVGGLTTFTGNVEIGGNLTVTGNTTQLNINELLIDDPVVHLAANNETSDLLDIGFLGHYSDDSGVTKRHAGIFRRASDERFYVFKNYVDAALDNGGEFTTFDINDASFQLADYIAANAEVNIITANSVTVNDYTLPTADGSANQIFITDGSGNVTFTDLPAGFTTGKAIAMAIVFGG